ncbi:MAG: hypothetical protein LBR69_00310 [Endomicrobium sp.]|jgi:hypothetical protein|nr:hypothetical protein [Endomicrobium sp.]
MRKILFFAFIFCFYFAGSVFSADQVQDASLSNGSAASSQNGFENTTSVNSGIVFLETKTTRKYRLDSGVLSAFGISNNDISFSSQTPVNNYVSTTTPVNIGITANTYQGSIALLGYRIAYTTASIYEMSITTLAYNEAGIAPEVSTQTLAYGFRPGDNYLQWFAMNTASDEGAFSSIIRIIVSEDAAGAKILQPSGGFASSNPIIRARLSTQHDFDPSEVTIHMFAGASTEAASELSVDYGTGKFVDSSMLEYKYTARTLQVGMEYTLLIKFIDGNGDRYDSDPVTFIVDGAPISQLLPYPSPYNPKRGRLKIKYVLSEDSSVTINIYDRAGKFVSKAVDSQNRPGGLNDTDEWNAKSYAGEDLASGVYICELIAVSGGKENRRYASFAILRK